MKAENVIKWLHGIAVPLTILVVMAMLMTSSTVTQEVMAASGVVDTFSSGDDEGIINYTREDENADYSIRLPKQSNVLEASMVFNGSDYLKSNVNKTIKSSFDWRQGTQSPESTFISDTSGFHLDMDTLAPFEAERNINAGSNVFSAAAGDFNDDGRTDLVVTNYDADTATVFLQNNQGKLVKDRDVNTDDAPRSVEAGDMNHDGRMDFAVGCYNGKSVNIFVSKATGGFTKSTVSLSYTLLDMDIADLNNDGRDDFVVAMGNSYGAIYYQSSSGTFSLHRSMTVTTGGYYYYTYYVRGCAAGDFNNDGRNDVAFTVSTTYTSTWAYQYYGMLKVHLQSSSGTFSSSHTWMLYAYNYAYGIDAGDVTGDGRDDIVITNHYINQIRLFTQRATGGFSGTGTTFTGATRPTWPRIADFDGDGKDDVVCGGTSKKFVFLKQKDGTLSTTSKKWDSNHPVQDVAAGDFNGDGLMDAATANRDGDNVGLWMQRTEYRGTWTSNAIVQPLLVRFINFSYEMIENGGETHITYSNDGGTTWTEVVNGTTYDLVNRTDRFWLKVTSFSTSASKFDTIKQIHMYMTYQTYPTNVRLDLGRDGSIEWNMSGELIGAADIDDLAEALTAYVQDSSHHADADGYVTVPLEIYSKTPGTLRLYDLDILYNNASRKPVLVFPEDRGFVNATPTLRFYANDTDGDMLKYVLQIAKGGDFSNTFETMTFDMRYDLFDQEPGEGFPEADFPEGTIATFTLPELYALEDDTSYSWRVFAFDGYLMSRPSPAYVIRVDSFAPSGHASTPRYSNDVNFTVTWSAEDQMPGSGMAPAGTYDVQVRKSTEPSWTDWLVYTTKTSDIFHGEEGVTYYFRMRSRDAVWNEQLYIGGKGDTQTTVDSMEPTVQFTDMPGFQHTRTFLVRWTGTDFQPGSGIRHYDVQVRKESGPWIDWLSEFKSSQSVYTADSDKTYHFRARATDQGGNVGVWSEIFSVRIDATPPVLLEAPVVPLGGEEVWSDLDSLTVEFAFVDQESGMDDIEVAIGTEANLYDVMPPTLMDYPADGVLVLDDLSLVNSFTYFVGIRAENQAGAWADWAWSDGVLVAIPGPESTMTYPEGRISDTEVDIDITVTDPRGYNVTLGDLRMRSATRTGDVWAWSDWARISNAKEDLVFEGKRGFRYQFKYRAQNELGSWGEFVEYDEDYFVFINNPPVANGGPAQIAKEGQAVQFSADASEDRDGDPLEYHWDFGDGSTSTELLPNHEYDKAGLYTVTLTVTDGYEESQARITVYVEAEEQTPGFGPLTTMLTLLGAALIAVGFSRARVRP